MVDSDQILSIAKSMASALCLGQRGFGFQGDRLPDIERARNECRKLLVMLGDEPNRRYDR